MEEKRGRTLIAITTLAKDDSCVLPLRSTIVNIAHFVGWRLFFFERVSSVHRPWHWIDVLTRHRGSSSAKNMDDSRSKPFKLWKLCVLDACNADICRLNTWYFFTVKINFVLTNFGAKMFCLLKFLVPSSQIFMFHVLWRWKNLPHSNVFYQKCKFIEGYVRQIKIRSKLSWSWILINVKFTRQSCQVATKLSQLKRLTSSIYQSSARIEIMPRATAPTSRSVHTRNLASKSGKTSRTFVKDKKANRPSGQMRARPIKKEGAKVVMDLFREENMILKRTSRDLRFTIPDVPANKELLIFMHIQAQDMMQEVFRELQAARRIEVSRRKLFSSHPQDSSSENTISPFHSRWNDWFLPRFSVA